MEAVISVRTRRQFMRYAIVGFASNLFFYLIYLVLTAGGLGPKTTMSFLYAAAVSVTFIFNKTWSFNHRGVAGETLIRYLVAYLLGYLLNFYLLWFAVDRLKMPHQLVQGVAIVMVAVILFIINKFWVFVPETKSDST